MSCSWCCSLSLAVVTNCWQLRRDSMLNTSGSGSTNRVSFWPFAKSWDFIVCCKYDQNYSAKKCVCVCMRKMCFYSRNFVWKRMPHCCCCHQVTECEEHCTDRKECNFFAVMWTRPDHSRPRPAVQGQALQATRVRTQKPVGFLGYTHLKKCTPKKPTVLL